MMEFNWADKRWRSKKGSQLFEELCYELIKLEGFENLKWRKGSFDGGRDLQADYHRKEPGGSVKIEKWWFQCKRYSKGISLNAITSSITKAAAEKIDYFVLMSTAYLTPALQDDIEKLNTNFTYKFRILDWTVKQIESLVTNHKDRITDLAKYFEEDFEKIFERIKKKEKERITHLASKKSQFENLIYKKKTVFEASIIKTIKELIEEYKQLKKYREAIDFLYEIKSKLKNATTDLLFELSILQSDIFIEMGSASEAVYILSSIEKSVTNDQLKQNLINYKKALALHIQRDFTNSLSLYEKSLKFFKNTNKNIYDNIFLDILKYHIDKEDFKSFDSLILKFKNTSKILNEKKIYLLLTRYNKESKYTLTIKLFNRFIRNINNKELKYKCLLEVAYAYWQIGDINKSVSVLEKKCIEIINELGDEEKLMIVYQNLSVLKMQIDTYNKSSWSDHTKWVDLFNKYKGLYHNALLSDLYSYEDIIEGKYRDALSSLIKSKNYIEELGSWTLINKNNKGFGTLFYHTGYYYDSLNYYIKIGDKDQIKKSTSKIIESDNSKNINRYINNWLNRQGLSMPERIGLCHTFASFKEVFNQNINIKIIDKLLVLTKDNSSFTSNYDIRRPAIDALGSISLGIPKNKLSKVFQRMIELYEDKSWDVRRKALGVINLLLINKAQIEKGLFRKLVELYKREIIGPEQEIRILLEECLINVAINHNSVKIKKEVVDLIKKRNKSILVQTGLKLGINFGIKKVEELVKNSINNINNSVTISHKEKELPNRSSGITMTKRVKGKKISVHTIGGLLPPDIFKEYNVKLDLISELVNIIIKMVLNENNFLLNRQGLINYLRFIPLPDKKIQDIFIFLLRILKNELPLSKDELKNIKESNPFSSNKLEFGTVEAVKKEAIMLISELYNRINKREKKKVEEIVIAFSYNKENDYRLACAYSFRFIPLDSLEKFLTYYSLLQDNNEQVFSYATFSFIKSDLSLWESIFIESVIKTIISVSDKKSNSLLVNQAVATALTKLLKAETIIIKNTQQSILKKHKELSKHKFQSVRKAAIYDLD